MKFKMTKTGWIVAAVVAFIIAVGIGIMCSGEKENTITIKVPQTTVDSVYFPTVDTLE